MCDCGYLKTTNEITIDWNIVLVYTLPLVAKLLMTLYVSKTCVMMHYPTIQFVKIKHCSEKTLKTFKLEKLIQKIVTGDIY